MKNLSLILITFLYTGCTLSPSYEKPNIEIETKIEGTKKLESFEWWKDYNDENINFLMNLMLKENKEIQIAEKEILINQEILKTTESGIFPSLNLKDDLSLEDKIKTNKFGISFSSYEIDYLGKINDGLKISKSGIKISELDLDYLKTINSYDLISLYFSLQYINKEIQLSSQKLKNYEELKRIYIRKEQIGLYKKSDVFSIENSLKNEKINLNNLIITKKDYEKNLKFLLGKDIKIPYSEIKIRKINNEFILSSQIEKRFDIQKAEQNLIIENAKIGLIKTKYFPTFSVSGFLGIKSNDLFSNNSNYWSLTPGFSLNLFDYGNTTNELEKQKIKKEGTLINYIKTVKNAFIDVKINLEKYKNNEENLNLAEEENILLTNSFNISLRNKQIGLLSKESLLIEENKKLEQELQLEKIKNNYIISELNLRKSLQGKIN